MSISQTLSAELEQEASNSRKMLSKLPAEHFTWKPHEKSFALGHLAAHVAELPTWVGLTVKADELDFATMNYKTPVVSTSEELMKLFEENLSKAKEDLQGITDETMMKNWSLRNKDHIFFTMPKMAVVRSMVLNHIIHHRAQLGVYLRLLNIAVPGMYGPTADEK